MELTLTEQELDDVKSALAEHVGTLANMSAALEGDSPKIVNLRRTYNDRMIRTAALVRRLGRLSDAAS